MFFKKRFKLIFFKYTILLFVFFGTFFTSEALAQNNPKDQKNLPETVTTSIEGQSLILTNTGKYGVPEESLTDLGLRGARYIIYEDSSGKAYYSRSGVPTEKDFKSFSQLYSTDGQSVYRMMNNASGVYKQGDNETLQILDNTDGKTNPLSYAPALKPGTDTSKPLVNTDGIALKYTNVSGDSNNLVIKTSDNKTTNTTSNTTSKTTLVCNNDICVYQMMAPINGLLGDASGKYTITRDSKSLCSLLNSWFRIGIALAGMLAVVMIVLGGFQYATTDSLFDKSDGKEKIQSALWGLMLALTTWLVLNTINPALTKCEIVAKVTELKALPTDTQSVANGALGVSTSGSGNSNGGTLKNQRGSIAANTLAGNKFNNEEWNEATRQSIRESGLLNLSPSDAAKFFPDGKATEDAWLSLFSSVAWSESRFKADDNTTEHKKDGNSSFSSEGLFSLSVKDVAVESLARQNGVSAQEIINNPITNIQASVNIMKNQVQKRGTITGGSETGYWGPLRRNE